MLAQFEAMLAHLGAMLGISGTYVGSSWGPLSGHLGAHCPPFILERAHRLKITQTMPIMPVRAARITDTTLEKHSVLAFLHLRRVAFQYAQ